jgi:MHS family proline/betaine transporter-like MFS transporter
MVVAAVSTIAEWYDFTLYLYLATVLSRVFFGGDGHSLSQTFASFAVAYLMRPLGAVLFGHVGDRYGRRRMMLFSMGLMTAATLATALLPTRAQVGPAAGWALLFVRCVMGFSVGGEYNGVVTYLLEGAHEHRRGLTTSMASAASVLGGLLAVSVSAITVSSLPPEALDDWGWRLPFAFGTVLAAGVWAARSMMQESPDFERQQAKGTVPETPLLDTIASHRTAVLRGFAISALGSITYYVGITCVPAFLTAAHVMPEGDALWLSTAASCVAIAVTPFIGTLSDRLGRRPVLVFLCLSAVALPVGMFWLMLLGSTSSALFGAAVLAAIGGGVSAVGAVATAEQFPGEGRLSGLALGATAATTVFGGLAPYLSQSLTDLTGSMLAPGAIIAGVALVILPVFLSMPETSPRQQESRVTQA